MLSRKNNDLMANTLFEGVEQSVVNSAFNSKNIRERKEGELIYKQGDESGYLYLILQGEVKIKFYDESPGSSLIRKSKNEFFGHTEMLNGIARNSSAVADTDCVLYMIDRNELYDLTSVNNRIYKNLKGKSTGFPDDLSYENENDIKIDEQTGEINLTNDIKTDDEMHGLTLTDEITLMEDISFDDNFNIAEAPDNDNPNKIIENTKYDDLPPLNENEISDSLKELEDFNIKGDINEFESANIDLYSEDENPEKDSFTFNTEPDLLNKSEDFSPDQHLKNNSRDFKKIQEIEKFVSAAVAGTEHSGKNELSQPLLEETARFIINNLDAPVQSIKHYSDLLKKQSVSEESSRLAEMILKQAESISSIVVTALDFAADNKNINTQPEKISSVMDEILLLLSDYADANKVKLYKKIETDAPVNIDKKRFFNACYQIAKNAFDAMPEGGNLFAIVNREGNRVKIEFADEGPGIPSSIKDEIFEPLSAHGKPEGTGLGLSISKKIIEEHSGYILVESELGEGTKVIINLPVSE
jgi:hypothetical protein